MFASPLQLCEQTSQTHPSDPEFVQRDRAVWSWFCTWGGDYIQKLNVASENYTDFTMWDKVYQSEDTLALDDLPCLWTYPLK